MNLLQYHLEAFAEKNASAEALIEKRTALMEAEGLLESDLRDPTELYSRFERALPAEYPEEGTQVFGNPSFWKDKLDFQQGYSNKYGYFGTCAPTSISNITTMANFYNKAIERATEEEVLEYGLENHYCSNDNTNGLGGATTIGGQLRMLEHYKLDAYCELNDKAKCERIAECIEGGYGVICGLNSRILRGQTDEDGFKMPMKNGVPIANHSVCMTGTKWENGNLAGFYMCDSSAQRPDGAHLYVPLDLMRACYENVDEGFIIVTKNPIRIKEENQKPLSSSVFDCFR